MVPAPTTHQRISRNLEMAMWQFVQERRLGEVLYAPVDVYLPGQETPVEPDVVYVSVEHSAMIQERGIEGAPDLMVEVFSPTSWWHDRRVKLPPYEETGVPECWLIDPKARTVEVYLLQERKYALMGKWGAGDVAQSEVLSGFQVEVDQVIPTRMM